MGDPLSVSAGVVGLVTVSTQLFIAVGSFIGSVKDAPALARDICSEIGAFQSCLGSVSNILSKSSFKAERGSLIAADNVVTTLTDAVLLFHDLDRIVRPLLVDTNQGVRYKRRWAQKKTKLAELVNRLQWHKQTLTLQLAIMKCSSDAEAQRQADSLTQMVERKLQSDQDLSRRLASVEHRLYAQSSYAATVAEPESDATSALAQPMPSNMVDSGHCEPEEPPLDVRQSPATTMIPSREFEYVLMDSWVYSRTKHRDERMSIARNSTLTNPMTMLSQITMTQMSVISVIALPIETCKLSNYDTYPRESPTWTSSLENEAAALGTAEETFDVVSRRAFAMNSRAFIQREIERWYDSSDDAASIRSNNSTLSQLSSRLPQSLRPKGPVMPSMTRRASTFFNQAWQGFDPRRTGYISRQQLPRFLGDLTAFFELGTYGGTAYAVRAILDRSPLVRSGATDAQALRQLSTAVENIDRDNLRRRRAKFNVFYEEALLTADPDRGIRKSSLEILLLWYYEPGTQLSMTQDSRLRRHQRLLKVSESIDRSTIIGFFDTLYWRRRFLRYRNDRLSNRARSAITSIPWDVEPPSV